MAQSPSPPPTRNPSGATTDPPFGPFADSGMGNPVFYHQQADDFDNSLSITGAYTLSGAGTAVHTPGDGGLVLLSSTASASTFATLQVPVAAFTLPPTGINPPLTSTTVKKLFYLVRLQLSDVTLGSFVAGLAATSASTFTTGVQTILDGIFFYKAPSSGQIQLIMNASAGNSPSGSAVSYTLNIPLAAYNLVNATFIDLAFYIDRQQNVKVFVGNPSLVGYAPQSGSGPVAVGTGVTLSPPAGQAAGFNQTFWNQVFTTSAPPYLFTTAVLAPTIGVSNGVTASAKTGTFDFQVVQKER
jgi:hypothetical protein